MDKMQYWDPPIENVKMVLDMIQDSETVLDVGGWWKPFTRANYVVDYLPYATRGGGGYIGTPIEHFRERTWFQMDICSDPLPFKDKEIDFVYCGQTLEDVRDPIWVCREMIRVGKRGYIEVPSLWIECQYGVDAANFSERYPGFEKHRWLVQVQPDKLTFIPKQVWLAVFKLTPDDVAEKYKRSHRIWTSYFVWDNAFKCEEMVFAGYELILPLLQEYFTNFDYSRYDKELSEARRDFTVGGNDARINIE